MKFDVKIFESPFPPCAVADCSSHEIRVDWRCADTSVVARPRFSTEGLVSDDSVATPAPAPV